MAETKTKPTKDNVIDFLGKVTDAKRRDDCKVIVDLMAKATKAKPEMWGSSIVGFGRYRYQYAGGREADWMMIGFSPRKNDLTLYITRGFESFPDLMKRLGKYKTPGGSCLYIKKLDDVDLNVLKKLLEKSVEGMADRRIDK